MRDVQLILPKMYHFVGSLEIRPQTPRLWEPGLFMVLPLVPSFTSGIWPIDVCWVADETNTHLLISTLEEHQHALHAYLLSGTVLGAKDTKQFK